VPVVQITAVPNVAEMIGVNRVLRGQTVPNVVGNAKLGKKEERDLRRKYVMRCLEILKMPVTEPQVYTLEQV
jgi:betaine reductase